MASKLLAPLLAASAASAGFLTSHSEVKSFSWTPPTHSFRSAVDEAYPDGHQVAAFAEGRDAIELTTDDFVSWVDDELLGGPDPFSEHGGVPVPWPKGDDEDADDGDQLGYGQYVAYSRRQLCYIVAKSFTGATTDGYANGLKRFFEKPGHGDCLPRTGDFGRGLVVFLETCYADPALVDGGEGPLLVVAKASREPAVDEVRAAARDAPLRGAGLRVCQYDDGAPALGDGVDLVPEAGCQQPTKEGPGVDFMTGGLSGQATQDISAAFLGGYVFGNACGLGGGQDERLMTYMPEVAALTFFLSEHWQYPQLRQPAWILGARMLFSGLDGTARFNDQLKIRLDAPITSDVQSVELNGTAYNVSSSRPFVAFMSENQGFFSWDKRFEQTPLARQNRLPSQRDVVDNSPFSFGKQVRAWYRSVALTSYSEAVRPAMKELVASVGTGPWLAGLWWGDSQLGFLAVWLGHAIAAPTWGEGEAPLPVDYYLYSAFTESPGNQCLVHTSDACQACMKRCNDDPLPDTAFWMPGEAFFDGHSCVPAQPDVCGETGVGDIISAYAGDSASDVWARVEDRLAAEGSSTESTVFDVVVRTPSVLLP